MVVRVKNGRLWLHPSSAYKQLTAKCSSFGILRGRLTFTLRRNPISGEIDGYDFAGPTRFDKLFTGIVAERPKSLVASHEGCEDIGAEDTLDADYGRLLEQVERGGVPNGNRVTVWEVPIVGEMCRV